MLDVELKSQACSPDETFAAQELEQNPLTLYRFRSRMP